MSRNSVKNFVICTLVILTVYQTVRLWFEDISSHNFFYSFFTNSSSINTNNIERPFFTPYRIIANDGNERYYIYYTDLPKIMREGHNFAQIANSFSNMEFIQQSPVDLQKLFSGRCFIYQYNFEIDTTSFLESIEVKNNNLLAKVRGFDTIVIKPSRNQYEPLKVIFLSDGNSYEYALAKNKSFDMLYDWISSNKNPDLYYDLSNNLEIIEDNSFIPVIKSEGFVYNSPKIVNPYRNYNGEELISVIEPEINMFFDNPSAKIPQTGEDYYVFSDSSPRVLYYYFGAKSYIEYNDYKARTKKNSSIVEDYNYAISFLKTDKYIINDVFLSGFEQNDEKTKTTFYFDYSIDNYLIILDSDYQQETNMSHHIEISVENRFVSHYKKIVLNYEISDNEKLVNVQYRQFLDFLTQDRPYDDDNDPEPNVFKDIDIVYQTQVNRTQKSYDDMDLKWFTKKDKMFFYPTYTEDE